MLRNRRRFLAFLPTACALGYTLLACNRQPTTGPVAIDWGRDSDTRCHMIIGDKFFAAQIREPDGTVRKFDDIGCAVYWLAKQAFNEETPGIEIWVADYQTGKWLAARNAHYRHGIKSPMRYQFAATAEIGPETVGYAQMKKAILAQGR